MFASRMVVLLRTLVLSAGLLLSHAALADGLVDQLPADGSWVKYQAVMVTTVGDQKSEIKGTVTLASVGSRVTEDQGACRWVELTSELSDGKQTQTNVGKFLIPETALARGQNPRKYIVKAWGKDAMGLKEEDSLPEDVASMMDMLLHAPLEESKPLAEAKVDCKLGALTCTGVTGSRSRKLGSDKEQMKLRVAARWNDKIPFGVYEYAARFTVTGSEPAITGSIRLVYEDSGKDAKSQLPKQD